MKFILFEYSILLIINIGFFYFARSNRDSFNEIETLNRSVNHAKKTFFDLDLYKKQIDQTNCTVFLNRTVSDTFCEHSFCCDLDPLIKCTQIYNIYNKTIFSLYRYSHCEKKQSQTYNQGMFVTITAFWFTSLFMALRCNLKNYKDREYSDDDERARMTKVYSYEIVITIAFLIISFISSFDFIFLMIFIIQESWVSLMKN